MSPIFFEVLNYIQALRGGQTERRPITVVLLIAGREVVSFASGSLLGFGSGQDFTHLAFVLNFNL